MRFFYTLLLFSLIFASAAFAQNVHQHGYQEIDYGFYPDEMPKSYERVQDWLQQAHVEIGKIMEAKHPRVVAWREAILAVPNGDDRTMLSRINTITNKAIPYVTDLDDDNWATPIGTLIQGGDCEDIALLKAVALNMRGWDATGTNSTHLLMGILNQNGKPAPHAVLEVDTEDGGHYVMHNMINDVLTFDDMNLKMKPLYMIDSTGIISFVKSRHSLASIAAGAGSRDGEAAPIKWDEKTLRY